MPVHEHEHTPGHCEHCRRERHVEREYTVEDQRLRVFAMALASHHGLLVLQAGPKTTQRFIVLGPDAATIDRYTAQVGTLAAQLDAKLSALTIAFVKKHTGATVTIAR